MNRYFINGFFVIMMLMSSETFAGVTLTPYASISSSKTIKPAEAGKETSTTDQKTTYGIRFGLKFYRIVTFQLSVGQNKSEKTSKTSKIVDSYGEIDYEEDLDMSTNDPDQEAKVTEVQRLGRAGLVLDPGFWILILRAQAGVQATQRIVTLEEQGEEAQTMETPITYKPYAGAGLGVKLAPRVSAIAEYTLNFYDFPDLDHFEREVAINFVVAI